MAVHQAHLSFNGGELTPYADYRADFVKHPTGAQVMANFLPMPFGGIRKRPGSLYRQTLAAETRIHPFIYDTSTRYVLAFTTSNLKIYAPDGTLKDTLTHTFGDPFALQFSHANDVLFIASANTYPQRLTRVSDTNWTLEDIPWDWAPTLDENDDESHTVTPTLTSTPSAWSGSSVSYTAGDLVTDGGSQWTCIDDHTSSASDQPSSGANADLYWVPAFAVSGTAVTLTASSALFDSDHVGGTWTISKERDVDFYSKQITLNTSNDGLTTGVLLVQGTYLVETFGNWNGTVTLERSKDNGATWTDVLSWESDQDRNVSYEGTEPDIALMRLRWDEDTAVAGRQRAVISSSESRITGQVEITGYSSATVVTGTVKKAIQIGSGVTPFWSRAAFDDYQGHPGAIVLHDRRLGFAGTALSPLGVWFSATSDLLNFKPGTDDDQAFHVVLAGTEQDPIRWMASQRRLLLGTDVAEWVIGADQTDTVISPTNFLARTHTRYGSAALGALVYHDGVFFIERQGRRLRELGYDLTREAYQAGDLTRLAEHITQGGIVQLDWQTAREPTLWAVRADGTLLAFYYIREERLAAWSRHTTSGGSFTSVAVLRNTTGDDDVFVVILRDGTYFLEQLASSQQQEQEDGNLDEVIHLDCAVTGTTDGSGNLTGLTHLEGESVTFLAAGIPGTATVSSGSIATGQASATATAGLPITSTLTTLPIDAVQGPNGSTAGRMKRAVRVDTNVYLSRGGSVVYDNNAFAINYDSTATPGDATPSPTSGWFQTQVGGGHLRDLTFSITHSDPWPFTLRAINLAWEVNEP